MNFLKSSVAIPVSVLLLMALAVPESGSASTVPTQTAKMGQAVEPSLAKSVTAAMFEHKAKKIFLIDVRQKTEFSRYHIAGALNIPIHAVKAKAFLKSKPVVLLNDGYEVGPPANACRALRKQGYKAYVLAGGLCAWSAAKGELTGDIFARREMNLITAAQFHRERVVRHQKVVHLSGGPVAGEAAAVAGAEVLPLSDLEKVMSRIRTWIKTKNPNPFTRIVLMTATGKENHRIRRRLLDAGLHQQVFVLKGGLQAYRKHLEFGQLAKKTKKERQKSTGRCQTCPRQ